MAGLLKEHQERIAAAVNETIAPHVADHERRAHTGPVPTARQEGQQGAPAKAGSLGRQAPAREAPHGPAGRLQGLDFAVPFAAQRVPEPELARMAEELATAARQETGEGTAS